MNFRRHFYLIQTYWFFSFFSHCFFYFHQFCKLNISISFTLFAIILLENGKNIILVENQCQLQFQTGLLFVIIMQTFLFSFSQDFFHQFLSFHIAKLFTLFVALYICLFENRKTLYCLNILKFLDGNHFLYKHADTLLFPFSYFLRLFKIIF